MARHFPWTMSSTSCHFPSELLRALDALDIVGETDTAPARRALLGLLAAYKQNRLVGEHLRRLVHRLGNKDRDLTRRAFLVFRIRRIGRH